MIKEGKTYKRRYERIKKEGQNENFRIESGKYQELKSNSD